MSDIKLACDMLGVAIQYLSKQASTKTVRYKAVLSPDPDLCRLSLSSSPIEQPFTASAKKAIWHNLTATVHDGAVAVER
ncbi:MAG: hypothetical protein GJ680_02760 [Alteromonadaceae bacterium]|nr:hypothetical protein [Alteromonadaceae bacterium]